MLRRIFDSGFERIRAERILLVVGWVVLAIGLLLTYLGLITLRGLEPTQQLQEFNETIFVPPGSRFNYLYFSTKIDILAQLGEMEDIQIEGVANEVDNLAFNLYLTTHTDYELLSAGKSYATYFEGKNRSTYNFSVSPSAENFTELVLVVEGENRAVEVSASIQWTGLSPFAGFEKAISVFFLLFGLPCVGGGLILIWIFKEKKKEEPSLVSTSVSEAQRPYRLPRE
jgi:hypothetical protein